MKMRVYGKTTHRIYITDFETREHMIIGDRTPTECDLLYITVEWTETNPTAEIVVVGTKLTKSGAPHLTARKASRFKGTEIIKEMGDRLRQIVDMALRAQGWQLSSDGQMYAVQGVSAQELTLKEGANV